MHVCSALTHHTSPPARRRAHQVRRMMAALMDPSHVDDRDYYGNKRLELAGGWVVGQGCLQLAAPLFRCQMTST